MLKMKPIANFSSKLLISYPRLCRCLVTNISVQTLGSIKFCIRPSVKARPHCIYRYYHLVHYARTGYSIPCVMPHLWTSATRNTEPRTSPSTSRSTRVSVCGLMCTASYSTCDENASKGIKHKSNIECSKQLSTQIEKYFAVHENFVSEDEQQILLREIEKHFKGLRYEYDHWDDAIHGYRETEKSRWSSETQAILQRVRQVAFQPGASQLPLVHVLDLAENGYIKPHVDSIKFCGPTIAGISLISPSIMKLVKENDHSQWMKVLLQPGSLYIMRDKLRFDYTHEILKDDESFINGEKVKRGRRVSIMFRDQPLTSKD